MPAWLTVSPLKVAAPSTTGRHECSAQDRVAGVILERDREVAARGWIPEPVNDLHRQPEVMADCDLRGGAGP